VTKIPSSLVVVFDKITNNPDKDYHDTIKQETQSSKHNLLIE